ncbi:MAG TPA: hypothetical protein VK700_17775 [Steroidobacteraceae bacterium]|nr:hypothetical protein [Steroidobacteraceae bacterium]
MLSRIAILAVAAVASVGPAFAASGCDPIFMQQVRQCSQIVDNLRPEKSGQARVFASDGSEFTAGQALWMQGQLRKVERLCSQSTSESQAEASATLAAIQDLLRSHQRASS